MRWTWRRPGEQRMAAVRAAKGGPLKIEWLNDEMTEAIVTRGWWRWQKQAHVARAPDCDAWFYVANGALVDGAFADDYCGHTGLCWALDAHKRNTLRIRETLATRQGARRRLRWLRRSWPRRRCCVSSNASHRETTLSVRSACPCRHDGAGGRVRLSRDLRRS